MMPVSSASRSIPFSNSGVASLTGEPPTWREIRSTFHLQELLAPEDSLLSGLPLTRPFEVRATCCDFLMLPIDFLRKKDLMVTIHHQSLGLLDFCAGLPPVGTTNNRTTKRQLEEIESRIHKYCTSKIPPNDEARHQALRDIREIFDLATKTFADLEAEQEKRARYQDMNRIPAFAPLPSARPALSATPGGHAALDTASDPTGPSSVRHRRSTQGLGPATVQAAGTARQPVISLTEAQEQTLHAATIRALKFANTEHGNSLSMLRAAELSAAVATLFKGSNKSHVVHGPKLESWKAERSFISNVIRNATEGLQVAGQREAIQSFYEDQFRDLVTWR